MSKTVQAEKQQPIQKFSIRLGKSCKQLANSLSALKLNGDEALWSVDPDGLYHASMDPSHVQLVEIRAASKSITAEGNPKFAVRVADLAKVIGRSEAGDSLQVSMDPAPSEKKEDYRPSIHLVMKNERRKLEYDVYLIDATTTMAPLPKLEPQVTMTASTSTLQGVLADMAVVADNVVIDTKPSKKSVTFSSDSDSGRAARSLGSSDGISIQYTGQDNEPVTSKYDIERISKYLKALKAGDVTIEYATKKPLKITSSEGSVTTTFYLAPRVQE